MPQPDKESLLASIVNEQPFPEFASWWKMGSEFIQLMSGAIVGEWVKLNQSISQVQDYVDEYVLLIYSRKVDPKLVDRFVKYNPGYDYFSGEFDAISYAFYRSAFEALAKQQPSESETSEKARRHFTKKVGKDFFNSIQEHLQLSLPSSINTAEEFTQLQYNLNKIEEFLLAQGYLRDKCEFTFAVDEIYDGQRIKQSVDDFLGNLHNNGIGYALYIMGYPAILPSAIYLFQMFGEAQHHSSRMIEELFDRLGYIASEADDFDPSGYPSDRVVEFWSIYAQDRVV